MESTNHVTFSRYSYFNLCNEEVTNFVPTIYEEEERTQDGRRKQRNKRTVKKRMWIKRKRRSRKKEWKEELREG